jgi:signal peptidase I
VEPLTEPSVGGEPFRAPVDVDPAAGNEAPDESAGDGRGVGKTVFELVGLVVLALVIALLIKTFLFQAFYIPS